MVYFPKFQILLGVDKNTGHILRLNKSRKIEKIGKAFPGDEPGKCFRVTPDKEHVLILTKPYKISAFHVISEEILARAGTLELSSRSLIQDFLSIDKKHVFVGTSSFKVYLYLMEKGQPNLLIAGLDIQAELSPNERFTRMSYNFRSKQIAMLSHNNILSVTNKVVLLQVDIE